MAKAPKKASTSSKTATSGKDLRGSVPRSQAAVLSVPKQRDPVGIIAEQNEPRLQDLVPVRIGRMLQSPFAFYRGTAAIMAADLSTDPTPDLRVIACGDAHISNFGFFASPERSLLFDLNDFDEASLAPFDWDLKRLVASVYIGGRSRGFSEDDCAAAVTETANAYRERLRELMQISSIERYFLSVDDNSINSLLTREKDRKVARKATKKARKRTSDQVLGKITTRDSSGRLQIVDQPPIMQHVEHGSPQEIEGLFRRYRRTLRADAVQLLQRFELVDGVLRVVGVGSVGTRCYVLAFQDPEGAVLFLQAKEAMPSVLVTYGGMPQMIPGVETRRKHTEGHRVVASQRILQAQSDPFLGWITGFAGDRDGRPPTDYYWRQFRDMKGSVDIDTLTRGQFSRYGRVCGALLARAHSQSPAASAIADYLGKSTVSEESLAVWSAAYADRSEADFAALEKAVAKGVLPAEHGV